MRAYCSDRALTTWEDECVQILDTDAIGGQAPFSWLVVLNEHH